MTAAHIAAHIRSAYQDGIRIARSKGRTLTVPVLGSHRAAEQIIRDTAAIGQEHGGSFLRVYEGMVALTLNNAQSGRGAFLTTGKITGEVNAQTVTGRVMSQDEIRPILLRLAADGAIIAGGYGWIVTAFSDRHPSETRPTGYKGKVPTETAPKRLTAADVFGRPTPAPVVAAPVTEWEPDYDPQPDTTGDDGYYDPAPVTRATSDEWEPRPNTAPVVPTTPERRTASATAGRQAVETVTREAMAVMVREALQAYLTATPAVLTAHLYRMPKAELAAVIERATAPEPTPAPVTRTRRPKGATLRDTAPKS